jgi:hypothetical protein
MEEKTDSEKLSICKKNLPSYKLEDKHRKQLAKLEFGDNPRTKQVTVGNQTDTWFERVLDLPTYKSHDDLQRVINGLGHLDMVGYMQYLEKIVSRDHPGEWAFYLLFRATPIQKAEAILKAKGMWE